MGQCSDSCIIPFAPDLAGPVDISSDGRFVVKLALDESRLTSCGDASKQKQTLTKSICNEISKSSGWNKGGTDLKFMTSTAYKCLGGNPAMSKSDKDMLFIKGSLPNDPVTGSIIKALCKAVKSKGAGISPNELAALSEIPIIPQKIASAVQTPSHDEAKTLARHTDPGIADNPLANGCGPADGWTRKIVPNAPLLFNFKPACDAHDINYSTLGVSKEVSDDIFLKDMLDICKKDYKKALNHDPFYAVVTNSHCISLANIYYGGVAYTSTGKKAYKSAQMKLKKE